MSVEGDEPNSRAPAERNKIPMMTAKAILGW